MALTIAMMMAGLGLFFVGKDLLTGNLRNLANRRIQLAIARAASSAPKAFGWGIALGGLIQNTPVVTFVMVGLLMARQIDVRRALPIMLGANAGSSLLILVVTLDIGTFVLAALGITGILLTIGRLQNWRTVLNAVFGLCLLYYGLVLLKTGAIPLATTPLFTDMMSGIGGSLIAAFVIGAVLAAICQSGVTVALLAITFMAAGFLSFDQAVMVVFGTNLGGSIVTYFLSSSVTGTARRLSIYQIMFNIIGCTLLVSLFLIERHHGVPLVIAAVSTIALGPQQQLALIYFAFNGLTALFRLPLIGIEARLLERFYPATRQEDDARLAYLADHAAADPSTAALMAEKEQMRLLERLPRYIEPLRLAPGPARHMALDALHQGFLSVHRQAQPYIDDLSEAVSVQVAHERVYALVDRQNRLVAIEALLHEFVATAPLLADSTALDSLRSAFTEGLDALLLSYVEAMRSGDAEEMALIEQITGDRSGLMDGVRRSFLSDATLTLGREEKVGLLQLTSLFERLVFLLRELALKAPFERAEKKV